MSENIVLRRISSLNWDSWRRWGRLPFIAVISFTAAAMMASSGVAVGLNTVLVSAAVSIGVAKWTWERLHGRLDGR